jgi:segregation and condensation protein B
MSMTLEAQIEAILYYRAEPVGIKELAEILEKDEENVKEAISVLKTIMKDRGLAIFEEGGAIELRTSPDAAILIEKMIKDEDTKELTKSALETLSIILYKGPITRRDIDFIRGVNSSFILRTLTTRGLIKKISNEKENKYETTTELLAHLGINSVKDLPEYTETAKTLEVKITEQEANDNERS